MKNNKTNKFRLDDLLVEKKIANDLAEARALIMAGKVVVNDQRIDKPSVSIDFNAHIRVKGIKKFVSRGGNKLEEAIVHFGLEKSINQKVVLDIGSSTGGFTDCALKYGAKCVIALDVGTNQLDWSLKNNPKVISLEKTDIRNFDSLQYPCLDWIIADISFNALHKLASAISKHGQKNCKYLLLVKPQFELDSSLVPTGGVVEEKEKRALALKIVIDTIETLGLEILGVYEPKTKGRKGNQEAFIYLHKVN